ncbi:superfamily II DNA or RNA helicase [Acinetobacter phage DMU1]|nr:superfamily II DNA or RNA helicase [Acinetobacter phage DMU1]
MSDLKVTINPDEGKIFIYCNRAYNDVVRSLPNRRWLKSKECWQAPLIRANAQVILDKFTRFSTFECSERALDKLREVASLNFVPQNLEKFPAWYKFKTNPFPHQLNALDFAWSRPQSAFFMEMGTGKSKTLIDLASARCMDDQINALIVFCPYGIRGTWEHEFSVHCPIEYTTYVVDTDVYKFEKKFDEYINLDHKFKIVIIGMESISGKEKDGKAYNAALKFAKTHRCMVVVDESQYIKNYASNRASNATRIRLECVSPVIMTGTPITQGYTDLFGQFEFLSPDIIGVGDFYSFRSRYCVMGGFQNKSIIDYTNTDELMDLLTPWIFQVKKEDVLKDLPPKTYTSRTVELTKEQKKLYDEIKQNGFANLKDLIKDHPEDIDLICENVLTVYSSLQQIIGGFVTYWDETGETRVRKLTRIIPVDKNPKIRDMMEVVEGIGNASMIIWARYREEIKMISEALRAKYGDDSVVEFHGGVTAEDREVAKAKFLNKEARFFVSNAETGGTGLTLNVATYTFYYSNDFKLVNRLQSEDRNHRIGQKNAVTYIDQPTKGTIDIKILRAIRQKKDLANYVKERISAGKSLMELLD